MSIGEVSRRKYLYYEELEGVSNSVLSYLSHRETISPNSPHSFDFIIRYS